MIKSALKLVFVLAMLCASDGKAATNGLVTISGSQCEQQFDGPTPTGGPSPYRFDFSDRTSPRSPRLSSWFNVVVTATGTEDLLSLESDVSSTAGAVYVVFSDLTGSAVPDRSCRANFNENQQRWNIHCAINIPIAAGAQIPVTLELAACRALPVGPLCENFTVSTTATCPVATGVNQPAPTPTPNPTPAPTTQPNPSSEELVNYADNLPDDISLIFGELDTLINRLTSLTPEDLGIITTILNLEIFNWEQENGQ